MCNKVLFMEKYIFIWKRDWKDTYLNVKQPYLPVGDGIMVILSFT